MSPAKSKREFDLDPILDEIGHFGKFQLMVYLLVLVPIVFNAFFTLSYVFTAASDLHRCLIEECDLKNGTTYDAGWVANAVPYRNNEYDQCKRYVSWNFSVYDIQNITHCEDYHFNAAETQNCKQWVYKDGLSIVSEFDLGCQHWKRTAIGTFNNIGQFVCLPLSGFISDKYGRRIILVGGVLVSAIIGTIRSFSLNYWMFSTMEFLDSALGSGIYSAAFILGIELVGPKQRVISGSIISSYYALGEVLLGAIAWQVPYWRHLLRLLYIPAFSLICYFWIVPESVRWLISKSKIQEAKATLTRAARINGTEITEKSLKILDASIQNASDIANDEHIQNDPFAPTEISISEESTFMRILKSPTIVIRIVVCSFWWMTCTFVYYGLSLNSVAVSGSMYMSFILVALIEIPAYLTTAFVMDRFGRKYSLSVSYLGSGIACLSFIFVPEEMYWLRMLLYLTGKFSITISFTALYVYTSELYPTPVRHSLLGTCSMFGRVGSIVAPQTPLLATYMTILPVILFGSTAIIAGLLVLPFPETLNAKLPDTIEEAENISKYKKERN